MKRFSFVLATALFAGLPTLALAAGAIDGGTKQALNLVAIGMFVAFVALTLGITYWAAKQTASAADFYSAGGGITGFQNGLAIAGDYMSAASFLGISGLVYTSGYDGLIYSVGWLVGWPIVTFLIAEQLRNLGKFTFADVTSFRLGQTEIRILAACGSLVTVAFYLIAQMVGAGKLIQLLFGLDYWMAVILVGGLMMIYVTFGGMKATTWVQIIKAVLLLMGATFMAGAVLYKFGFSPEALFARATEVHPKKAAIMEPGSLISNPLSAISLGLALMFGTAGLPHILMRFFTVKDAQGSTQVGLLCDRFHRLLLHPHLHHRLRRDRARLDRFGVPRCGHSGEDQERNRGDQGWLKHGGDPSRQRGRRQLIPRLHIGGGLRHHPRGRVGPGAGRRILDQP